MKKEKIWGRWQDRCFKKDHLNIKRLGWSSWGKHIKPWNIFAKKKVTLFMHVLWNPNIKWRIVSKPSKFVKNQLYWEKNQYSTSHWILNEVFLVDNSIQKESDPVSPFILIWNLIWSLELAGGNLRWLFCLKRKKKKKPSKKEKNP